METWIHSILDSGQSGILVLLAVFLLGMTGVLTCACNYALFAVVAGFSGSTSDTGKPKNTVWSGIAFLAGVVLTMALIGALFGFSGKVIGASFGTFWYVVAGLMCIFFGLYTMDFLPFRLPEVKIKSADTNAGYLSAIIFGLTVGGISTAFNTCCNPIFPVILAASFIKGSMLWGILMLSTFALGFALPLALGFAGIRLTSGRLSKTFRWVGTFVKYAGGILLIIMGFYFLYKI